MSDENTKRAEAFIDYYKAADGVELSGVKEDALRTGFHYGFDSGLKEGSKPKWKRDHALDVLAETAKRIALHRYSETDNLTTP